MLESVSRLTSARGYNTALVHNVTNDERRKNTHERIYEGPVCHDPINADPNIDTL